MKTTKEQQGLIRKMAVELNEKNPGPAWHIMLELLDDIDELSTRLAFSEALLERAKKIVDDAKAIVPLSSFQGSRAHDWLEDYEKGFKK